MADCLWHIARAGRGAGVLSYYDSVDHCWRRAAPSPLFFERRGGTPAPEDGTFLLETGCPQPALF